MAKGAAIAVLAALAVAAQVALYCVRPAVSPMAAEGVFAALGGLRSIISEVVWFRADRLQEEGRYVELAQLARALALAEPHNPEIWSYAAWNLAYNVSVMMPSHEDRWRWVNAGISLLRDEALKYNPASADIFRDLAWMFELKVGAGIDSASPTYRRLWRETVDDVAARCAWHELGMDESVMEEAERLFGVRDRGDAQYSAIYWAFRGLAHAKGRNARLLREIIRQARMIYDRSRGPAET